MCFSALGGEVHDLGTLYRGKPEQKTGEKKSMLKCERNCCRCPERDTCADKNKQLLNKLFTRYGNAEKTSDKKIYIYERHPETLHTAKTILNSFNSVERTLEELEEVMEELKAYRVALTERYNFIATAPTKQKIKLYREKKYGGKVFYFIQFYTVNLVDGYEDLTEVIRYEGKERKKAIERFEQLKKEKTGVIFEQDIERARWER